MSQRYKLPSSLEIYQFSEQPHKNKVPAGLVTLLCDDVEQR